MAPWLDARMHMEENRFRFLKKGMMMPSSNILGVCCTQNVCVENLSWKRNWTPFFKQAYVLVRFTFLLQVFYKFGKHDRIIISSKLVSGPKSGAYQTDLFFEFDSPSESHSPALDNFLKSLSMYGLGASYICQHPVECLHFFHGIFKRHISKRPTEKRN